ncbi:AAA family ATPase [Histoplasma capsulatum var. duboisii H88]|uniref:AAA family ATPase n=1 Tax=Ajellomyces capsulatus (strain H88) TaxID=544711 RepID=A0A8A1LSQ4_AJEC8|nr:AAA family ATPase [Histoplasma capsulatum var. duboisii H88]
MRVDVSETLWKWRCKMTDARHNAISMMPSPDGSCDDPKSSGPHEKEPEQGLSAVVKTLYEGRNSTMTYFDWQDYPPRQQLSKKAAKENDRVAIVVYKVKDHSKPVMSGRFSLKYHSLDIQSPILVSALKDTLKEDEVYLEGTETAKFEEPFSALYFRSDEVIDLYRKAEQGSALKAHLELLVKLMGDIFSQTKFRVKRLQDSGLVSWRLAWTYFPRGSYVYSWENNREVLTKVLDATYETEALRQHLSIRCKIIIFDGENFIWKEMALKIPMFAGNLPITQLPHYPLRFHENPAAVIARLKARATNVLELQGLQYKTYTDIAIDSEGKRHNVDGRILIDARGYYKYQLKQPMKEMKDPEYHKKLVLKRVLKPVEDADPNDPASSRSTLLENGSPSTKIYLSEEEQRKNKEEMLEIGDDMALLQHIVHGYALRNKEWLNFYVDELKPVEWNDEAYEHLVYDKQQKDLVLSFVENHHGTQRRDDDVIAGKGQGLNILLSGPPGTGKTLTAEAVADRCRRPLFYLQAEDLGILASELGPKIKRVFEMAIEWDAVILLDEADVFMSERHPNDIARNELVSIFLRELEYYRGIIFLTTNLYETIDTAFRSRLNLHLLFSPLTPETRETVWRKFLERMPPMAPRPGEEVDGEQEVRSVMKEITDEDLKELAMWQLNGREIKNAAKMAKSWCDYKGYDMTLSRIESGIKVTAPNSLKRDHTTPKELYD